MHSVGTLRFACILMSVTACGGCSSFFQVPVEQQSIKIGSKARIATTTGEILEIEVTGFEGDHVLGPDRRIAFSDIDSLEIKRLNRRSLYITLGVIGGAILLLKDEDETCSSYSVCDGYFVF